MKNLFLLFALFCLTTLSAQNKFDGKWVYEPSDYILNIQTKNNKIYSYNYKIKDTLHEYFVDKNDKQILTKLVGTDNIYYIKYEFINEKLTATFLMNNYKITYKKL